MRVQVITWFFSTVITIGTQIYINTIETSIPRPSDLLGTSITCKLKFKPGRISCFEQTDILLDINLPFKMMLRHQAEFTISLGSSK